MGVPALFAMQSVLELNPEAHQQNIEYMRRVAQLGRDFGLSDHLVLCTGIGGKSPLWERQRGNIVRLLGDYA